jgi:hypothetical protein
VEVSEEGSSRGCEEGEGVDQVNGRPWFLWVIGVANGFPKEVDGVGRRRRCLVAEFDEPHLAGGQSESAGDIATANSDLAQVADIPVAVLSSHVKPE